ncbi:MAG: hypothetical protein EPO20_02850 [Betaproteobacteria bacterium]|nr:MAG: hypothetical protein EPO20_02850 [Betaproteobacteria bacterium]
MKPSRRAWAAVGIVLATAIAATAHAATQTRTPASCVVDASIGTVNWTNPANALTSNNSYATAAVAGAGTTTRYLECTGYGFTLPPNATINGITVDIERRSSSAGAGGAGDAAVRIVQGGVIGTADRSTATTYTTADVTEAHGGATDLWGLAWTTTDINAANFGAAFAALKNSGGGGTFTLSVDVVSITVDYTPDTTPPTVVSIVRADPDPTSAASVSWTVTFSEDVTGVDASDFALAVSGLSGSSITLVTGGPLGYTVTADTGYGTGTLGLNLADNDSILDAALNPLGGAGAGNGSFTGQAYSVDRPPPVANFNVVEPGADAVAGRIYTKIAGQNISVDIVALDASNAVSTAFTGTVAVELVDNSGGGACAGLPLIKALANETFVAGDNGRHALSAGQFEAEARRNVRVRVKYPSASPTITACSSDAFANRPASFTSLQARDQTRTSAGSARALNNVSDPGTGTVHNAGRPFQIDAIAQNGAGVPAATVLYSPDAGQPVAVLAQCGSGTAACTATLGTLTLGSWSAAAGALSTTTASYSEAGSFDLALEDQTFSSVDNGDGTPSATRYIRSAAPITVGRFVPDHFAVAAGAAIVPRSDIAACAASSFTYLGERMDLSFTLRAESFAGTLTQNYTGTLAALALNNAASYNFGAIDSTAPTPLTARLDLSLVPAIAATWSAGQATIAAPIAIARAANPDGPFASVKIGIAPADPDSVTLPAFDLDVDNDATNEHGQVGSATALRFGRLRLENAVGSEKLDLPIPLQVQYWAGTAFQVNAADNCTSLAAANLALGDYYGGIDATNMASANISLGGAFAAGIGTLALTKPNPLPASAGAVTLSVNLTAEGKSYLKGNWAVPTYTADPRSRAAFGLFGNQPKQFIYFRENY